MNTVTAPNNKYLIQIDDSQEPLLVKEVTGNGDLDSQYKTANDYNICMINKTLEDNELIGGGYLRQQEQLTDWERVDFYQITKPSYKVIALMKKGFTDPNTGKVLKRNTWLGLTSTNSSTINPYILKIAYINPNQTSLYYIFNGSTCLVKADLTGFDMSKVTNMGGMFAGCFSLTEVDLSDIDTSKVNTINSLFVNCPKLEYINLSGIDTSNVTDMANIFNYCLSLRALDLSYFNTSKVTNMSTMFRDIGCTSLDLSSFDTRRVTNMWYMFFNTKKLEYIDLSSFNTVNVANMGGFVTQSSALKYIKISPSFFLTKQTINVNTSDWNSKFGLAQNNSSNGWIEHFTEQAPVIRLSDNWNQKTWEADRLEENESTPHILTQENGIWYVNDGIQRTIDLPRNLKNLSWIQPYITILQEKGYTIV